MLYHEIFFILQTDVIKSSQAKDNGTPRLPSSAAKIQHKIDKDHKAEIAFGIRHIVYCDDKKTYVKCGVCKMSLTLGNRITASVSNFIRHEKNDHHKMKLNKRMQKSAEPTAATSDSDLTPQNASTLEKASLIVKNEQLFCRPCKFTFTRIDKHNVKAHLNSKSHLSNKVKFCNTGDLKNFFTKKAHDE